MPTRDIVPRGDGEGSVGTSAKQWGDIQTKKVNGMNVGDLGGVPIGFVAPFTRSTAPDGWLACQGAEVSRAAYPDLWNYINGSSQLISESDWQNKNVDGDINIGWFSSGDGTTTFRLPRIVGSGEMTEVKRFTTAGSGSFVAPITGIYKITLQGAGGGGAGAGTYGSIGNMSGGGGGQGGHGEFYEKLIAGQTYSFTIGAGGTGGSVGNDGGDGGASSISVGANAYVTNGGQGGKTSSTQGGRAGNGGNFTINGVVKEKSAPGGAGSFAHSTLAPLTGIGGGNGGAPIANSSSNYEAVFGGGGAGGSYNNVTNPGGKGGDGYIEFAYNPVPQYWYVRAFGSATNQGTIDITELANMLNDKADIDSVLPLFGGGALTGTNLTWNGADLGGSAIVAKSLGQNGYIKYASGLIIQWGQNYSNGSPIQLTFPISFTANLGVALTVDGPTSAAYANTNTLSLTGAKVYKSASVSGFRWVAIGY